MPFDARTFAPVVTQQRRMVALWLFGIAFMILVMIVLGGATRLTGSGLSIMEWAPFQGALPPLREAEWQRLYALYQQIPQYTLINQGFGIDGFRHIFWLEWTHRLWGRLIGIAFLLPLIWFCWKRAIDRALALRLVLFFVLGGLQGAVGWFMVASGFAPDSIAVAPLRLVLHLALALALYGAILWTALSLWRPGAVPGAPAGLRPLAWAVLGLVVLTIIAGGFTAGMHAGLTYNTFPLMDGHLVPEGYAALSPWPRNLIANIAAVQFDHRLLATLTALASLGLAVLGLWRPGAARMEFAALAIVVAAQYVLGVTTLLLAVPVDVAVAHQAGAALLLTAVLFTLHALRRAPMPEVP
jgi:cytochrome c oxidase assembly protein subunit 15